ncbi:MAG: hypothetical protein BroJett025_03050 [Patescibacteria group bacterium]|nr:MAG: hypothetical protein BroJett025_03050 [Patescibacteria group bacterium]
MKTLVFGDTHLTNRFDSELFDYIAKLVKSADQVIINGDFWDAYLTTFDKFCNSEWCNLFPLLKEKKTVYVFGNHDKQEYMDDRYLLFSDIQLLEHTFTSGNKKFKVQHGHLIAPAYDARFLFRNNVLVRPFYQFCVRMIEKNEFIRDMQHKSEFDLGIHKINFYIQNISKNFEKDQHYIFGHTHIHKQIPEYNIINIGVLQNKRRHYLLIEDGNIQLVPKKQQHESKKLAKNTRK